jgi:hypothetical protein
MVSGPGQNAAASRAAAPGHAVTSARAASGSVTWAMSGLKLGRPLAAKMRATADASSASAARP